MSRADGSGHVAELRVAATHPCLAGHFPGNPVVPGVLILDAIVGALEGWTGSPVRLLGIPQVKFLQPLLPGQAATIELARDGSRVRFRVLRDAQVIASGELGMQPP